MVLLVQRPMQSSEGKTEGGWYNTGMIEGRSTWCGALTNGSFTVFARFSSNYAALHQRSFLSSFLNTFPQTEARGPADSLSSVRGDMLRASVPSVVPH